MHTSTMKDCCLMILLALPLVPSIYCEKTRTIETRLGLVTGLRKQQEETKEVIYEFRGIRYAKAPVGSLRFEKPVPVEPWEDEYDATKFGPACPQSNKNEEDLSLEMDEDCLFLNIYVPKSMSKSKKRSVMVWVHGGSFRSGSSSRYDGSRMALGGDVIVVTLNYRLGILGFLSLLDPKFPGNYGLWDQKAALGWIHDNIADYGGDPESVTLFGQGAGGISIMLQSLISSNKGQFKRVISQSGYISNTTMLNKDTVVRGMVELKRQTECEADDITEFMNCLRKKSFQSLIELSFEAEAVPDDQVMLETMFSPCVDGQLLFKHPMELLDDTDSESFKLFADLDLISGTTLNEGSILYDLIEESTQKYYDFNKEGGISFKFICDCLIEQIVDTYFGSRHSVKETLCEFYSANSTLDQSMKSVEFMTDYLSTLSHAHALDQHAGYGEGETYQYVFSKQSSHNQSHRPVWSKGAWHGDDLFFLSILKDSHKTYSKEDQELSDRVIQYWTSFAKTGKPYGGTRSHVWLSYDTNGRIYLDFDTPFSMRSYYRHRAIEFWKREILAFNYEKGNTDKLSEADHDEL